MRKDASRLAPPRAPPRARRVGRVQATCLAAERRAPRPLQAWVGCRLREGIGGYALAPSSRLGSDHPLAEEGHALRLFAQWATHWDLSRPVLLEKSPSNARAIGMLAAMWRLGRAADARFIFISRHPLLQALAMRAFVEPADAALAHQVEHWCAVEESIRADARAELSSAAALARARRAKCQARPKGSRARAGRPPTSLPAISLPTYCSRRRPLALAVGLDTAAPLALASHTRRGTHPSEHSPEPSHRPYALPPTPCCAQVALLSLEGLALRPQQTLTRLLDWLGLRAAAEGAGAGAADSARPAGEGALEVWARGVRTSPNERYIAEYREALRSDARAREEHASVVRDLGERVALVSGYALGGPLEAFADPPSRDEVWQRQWVDGSGLALEAL